MSEFSHTTLHWESPCLLTWHMWKKRDILVTLLPNLTRFPSLPWLALPWGRGSCDAQQHFGIPAGRLKWTLDFYCAFLLHKLIFLSSFLGRAWTKVRVLSVFFLRNVPTKRFVSVTLKYFRTRKDKGRNLHCYCSFSNKSLLSSNGPLEGVYLMAHWTARN